MKGIKVFLLCSIMASLVAYIVFMSFNIAVTLILHKIFAHWPGYGLNTIAGTDIQFVISIPVTAVMACITGTYAVVSACKEAGK